MKCEWKIVDGKSFLGFRKVGDLQCYGTPFLSLYYDINERILLLSLAAYKRDNYSSWLFFYVSKEDVISYLNSFLSLREWMKICEEEVCFLKKEYSNTKIEWYESIEIPQNLLSDDDFFEEDFCKDKHRIRNFLASDQYVIRNSNIPII